MKLASHSSQKTKRTIIVLASVLLVSMAGYAAYATSNGLWPFSSNQTAHHSEADEADTSSSPTEVDESDSQSAKKEYVEDSKPNEPQAPAKSAGKKAVDVGVSFADIYDGKLEVRAFTSGTIESGSCKVTAKHASSGSVVSESSKAFIDASTTQCEPVYIPVSKLAEGEWDVSVEFSSKTHQGVSESRKVNVS